MKNALLAEGSPFILFGGGPLLVPLEDLEELWRFGLERFGYNGVQTNGVLIDDRHVELFRKYKVHVGISMDGPGALNDARWQGSLAATRAPEDSRAAWFAQKRGLFAQNGYKVPPLGIYEDFLAVVDRPGATLELGCGNGLLLRFLRDHSPHALACSGVDLNAEAIRTAQSVVFPERSQRCAAGLATVGRLVLFCYTEQLRQLAPFREAFDRELAALSPRVLIPPAADLTFFLIES